MKHSLRAALIVFIVVCLVFLAGLVNARVVRLRQEQVGVDGLDSRLDGLRVLFVSDLKISDALDAYRCAGLINSLCGSGPQLLIIGGDLTSSVCSEDALKLFLDKTSGLSLSCGMYIVYGDSDILIPDSFLDNSPFELLNGGQKKLYYNGAPFVIVGYDGMARNTRSFAFTDEGTGLCIVAAHDPEVSKLLPYRTDAAGTPYCDLFLCGHTLGGQVDLFGYKLLYHSLNLEYPTERMNRFTIPVIISQGIGTEYLPVRFGTEPTAYMITLTNSPIL